MIEFKTRYDSKTLGKLTEVQIKNSSKLTRGFTWFFFIMGALLLLFAYDDYTSGEPYYMSLGIAIFSICFGMMFPSFMKNAMKKAQDRQNASSSTTTSETEMLFKFDKDRLFIFATRGEKFRSAVDADYDYIFKVYEDDDAYILYISKMECYVLNKTDLVSGTHEEFQELLTSVLPAYKIEKNLTPKK